MRDRKSGFIGVLGLCLLAGSAVGVAAQDAGAGPVAPVEFTATWHAGPEIRDSDAYETGGVVHATGSAFRPVTISEATDPRLRGTLSIAANSDDYRDLGGPQVWSYGFRIETEDGVWQQTPTTNLTFSDGSVTSTVGVFVGEGGYEGLIAVFEHDRDAGGTWDLRGYIIEGALPPAPEPVVGQ